MLGMDKPVKLLPMKHRRTQDSRRRHTERRAIVAGLSHQKLLGFLARFPACRPATAAVAEEKNGAQS